MGKLLDKVERSSISRRKFVGIAASVGAVTTLGLTGCENKVVETEVGSSSTTAKQLSGGEWITFRCGATSCIMSCVNQAYVVDGIIVRQRTDELHPDTDETPQHRGCLKGRSMRHWVTSADRLKYPMKRKNWRPGGGENINGHLRGVDEWERISWDEAISYIADEFTRIRNAYGNRAFLALSYSGPGGGLLGSQILNLMGGCLSTYGQQSNGGTSIVLSFMRGHFSNGLVDGQDRMTLRNTKLMVFWGFNPAWSGSAGNMYDFLKAKKESGAEVILVDPFFNPSAQALVDIWVPIRPGTDGAMLEAIAYEMITNDWQDQDFLDRCCVGFDADHMPADAKTNENFKDHILGAYDGQPKTPEWASAICGASADEIRYVARKMGKVKPMTFKAGLATSRTYYGNRTIQLLYTIGWMAGSVGVPGAEITTGVFHIGVPGGLYLVAGGASGYKIPPNPICNDADSNTGNVARRFKPEQEYGIPFTEAFKAIVEGKYHVPGPGPEFETRDCDIKCIYREFAANKGNQESGNYWLQEAFRKVEFVAIPELFMTVEAMYADIVLPVITNLERDFASFYMPEFTAVGRKVIEPYYEAKDDLEIFNLLADKLGFGEDVAPRTTTRQLNFNSLLGATVAKDSPAERESLVSVTEDDLEFYDLEGKPQEGRIPIQEFLKTGTFFFERSKDDSFMNVWGAGFRQDPAANPAPTVSGKYEIYCQSLKDYYDSSLFHDIDALPKYKPMVDGYEQTLQDPTYPFQLITPHQLRQVHSTYYNVKQITEVFPNDLIMNQRDAQEKGLNRGDWVLISCAEGGKILRRINAVPHVMPGVVILGEGNWQRIDQESGIDVGGCSNTVTRSQLIGDGFQAYNSVLVKIEKYSGDIDPVPDYQIPPFIPTAE